MVQKANMKTYIDEIYFVYRLRNKKTGRFLTGGRSTNSGIYVYLPALRVVKRGLYNPEEWEIIKYNVTIEGIVE